MATTTVASGTVSCHKGVNETMNIYIAFAFCLLLLAESCSGRRPTVSAINIERTPGVKLEGISKEAAVDIANEEVTKDYQSPSAFNVVVCEQSLFWRVIYDGGGPEYVIDKTSGRILTKQKLPQGPIEAVNSNTVNLRDMITAQEAIRIAREEAFESYGDKVDLNQFDDVACEQSQVWRVILDYRLQPGEQVKDVPNGSFPKYVIDKKSGRILFKEIN